MKKLTILFFIIYIFIFPIIHIITPDENLSEIDNKILTKFPRFNIDNIMDSSFMKNFDIYATDQFPFRVDFLKLNNNFKYISGAREFRDIYICKDRLIEKFIFNKVNIDTNISQVITLSEDLASNFDIKSTLMVVPTSISFYSDELPTYAMYDSQPAALNHIKSTTSNNINFYSPVDILDKYKNEYIYFKSDHHWTQLGAYISYLDFYNKDVDSNVINSYEKVADSFLGTYYSKTLISDDKADDIYAFTYFDNHHIDIDFSDSYETLYDYNALLSKNKYQYFLHGDPAFALIEGNESVTKELLIFKDSFAHNFIPFLTSDYSKIHVVDPRYYDIDLDSYLNDNKNIKEVLFLHNIQSINNSIIYK